MSGTIFCNFGTEYRKDGKVKRLGCSHKAHFELPGYQLKKDVPVRSCSFHLARTLNERIVWLKDKSIRIKRIKEKRLQAGAKKE